MGQSARNTNDRHDFYRAITVSQPFATLISTGQKTIEMLNWQTNYRGPLLIKAAGGIGRGIVKHGNTPLMAKTLVSESPELYPIGVALCIVDLLNVRPMTKEDEQASMCPFKEGMFAWEMQNFRLIEQVKIKGWQGLYRVQKNLIKLL